MQTMPIYKYRPFPPVMLTERLWPSRVIKKAPVWCSVDLRDGNQALVNPMGSERKFRLFNLLVELGFKEIEIGFPAASETDYSFVRQLIEKNCIPEDVTVQVLTQARDELIIKTFEALKGVRRAIVHLYNSTSTLQRRVVFGMDKSDIIALAVRGAETVHRCAIKARSDGSEFIYQYSPESFTGTELDFSVDICTAVMEAWQASLEQRVILNLPATVEMSTPNVYADQIEWFINHLIHRERVIISVHPHNDRGTGVAAAELAMLAGADRIEGTLFGNGERTGNVDLVNLALNLFTQGIDPELDLSNVARIKETAEYCSQLPIHPRHPYVGDLVFTAFSGSHQDAIKKGLEDLARRNESVWEVPYLPIDPHDIGCTYETVVRINSQSGKGGVSYIMKVDYGLDLPRSLQIEFSSIVQEAADSLGEELSSKVLWRLFEENYLSKNACLVLESYKELPLPGGAASHRQVIADVIWHGKQMCLKGTGNGPVDAFSNALRSELGVGFTLTDYREHALTSGSESQAVAFVQLYSSSNVAVHGVGIDNDITVASLKAVACAVSRI